MEMVNGLLISAKQSPDGWIQGNIDGRHFSAKVYDEGSRFGIDEGPVSKLAIWFDDIIIRKRMWVATYDRGWDVRPKKAKEKKLLAALLEYLGNLPTAEDWEQVAEKTAPFRTCIEVKGGYPTNVMVTITHTGWAKLQDCLTGIWYKQLDPIAVRSLLARRNAK